MVSSEEVVRARVANIVGVPLASTLEHPLTPPLRLNKSPPKHPPLKRIRLTKERGDLTESGYIYKAMTNLGVDATQLKYDVTLRSLKGVEPQKVVNKQTTPEGGISCTVPELVHVTTKSEISGSNDSLPHYPVTGSKVYIKWEEQQIGEDTYAKGQSAGLILRPSALSKLELPAKPVEIPKPPVPRIPVPSPKKEPVWYFDEETLICKELGTEPISKSAHRSKTRGECYAALRKHVREARETTPKPRVERAIIKEEDKKRKISARAEELMKKRSFPKAVKEAIEKGLERKDAPRDIERMIEKVAKTNEPNYMLKRTLAKRTRKGGVVQYKVVTDKGTIVYENADEQTKNAILGMPTPTGEVIPLQIKVVR